jgi:ABC-2 type transport system permease protein
MSNATALFALVRKDLLLYLHDRRALLLNLLMPIILAAFFGYLFGGSGATKPGKLDIAVVLQDRSPVAARIAAGLAADDTLHVTRMDLAAAEAAVRKGAQKAAVVLPPGFADAAGQALFGAGPKPALTVLYDPSQSATLAMVRGLLTQQVMQEVPAEMFNGSGGRELATRALRALDARPDAANAALRDFLHTTEAYLDQVQALQQKQPQARPAGLSMPFTTTAQPLASKELAAGYNGYAHSFGGMAVQFTLFMAVNMGIAVLTARRAGIMDRLLAAPITMRTIIIARFLSVALIAFALVMAIFAAAVLIFKVHIVNPLGFVGVVLCFALLTSSFGLLIAAFGKTPEAARGIAVFATLIMVMLGGAWVPSFIFPAWIQQVALVLPTRWAIDGFDAMTWRGLGLDAAVGSMGVQLLFTAVFVGLALWQFGRSQER